MRKLFHPMDAQFEDAEDVALMKAQGLIEWVMDRKSVTQKELAERLGVSQSAVSQLLGLSPKNLSVKKLARILRALGDEVVITSATRDAYLSGRKGKVSHSMHLFAPSGEKRETSTKYRQLHANENIAPPIDIAKFKPLRPSQWHERAQVA
ncbi:MAG: XRE family transcriptional regulator [Parvularculaceae bacterium]